jgi:hypothetical protein
MTKRQDKFVPHHGAVRYPDTSGGWVCANISDQTFATVNMFATQEYRNNKWHTLEVHHKEDQDD